MQWCCRASLLLVNIWQLWQIEIFVPRPLRLADWGTSSPSLPPTRVSPLIHTAAGRQSLAR